MEGAHRGYGQFLRSPKNVTKPALNRTGTTRWLTLACVALFGLLMPLAAVQANHTQTGSGKTIVFDHRTGNEWWVELILTGASASSVSKVESMDTGGAW